MIATLDFEASSLCDHGFPIEVACVIGCDDKVIVQFSTLIRPRANWNFRKGWSATSQLIHGIEANELEKGLPADRVSELLNALLIGHCVIVDGGSYDSFWLERLFDGQAAAFSLDHLSGIDAAAFIERKRQASPTHRALPDALWLFDTITRLSI